ncbi:glycoside hydrolase family 31 protein [Pleomorphovibrio marinus]|uniref:glycoside hydrolase family 31 protein n=1 Tax=Pleomorphovibrio marinus TaxID=2164132 RepID=UPI000E0ADEA6|nr:alpha-xylosidase [Pleomorphovibrio marinus]
MKHTNYPYFDFLEFDPEKRANPSERSLWIAEKPEGGTTNENGEVEFTVPFSCQKNENNIEKKQGVDRQLQKLKLTAYGENVLRLSLGEVYPDSPMLSKDLETRRGPLFLEQEEDIWTIRDDATNTKGEIDFAEELISHWSDLLPPPQDALKATFYPKGSSVVSIQDYDQFFPARREAFSLAYITGEEGEIQQTYISIKATHKERFCGTGERFSKMDLSGKTFWLKNQDAQGTNNKRAYKNVPFYISSEGYGLFLHTSYEAKISLADHSSRSVQLLVSEPRLDVFFIGGDSPAEILYAYRQLTGFPSLPPLWSFGIWMSRMTYFAANEVMEICERLRAEDFPCDVIHLDTGWFRTDWLCEWRFHPERFPDPKGFVQELLENGFRLSLWQMPYIAEEAIQLQEARENNYIGPRKSTGLQGGSNFSALDYAGTIDFTYTAAKKWYQDLLKELLEMGVACIKTDFGEEIHMDATYKEMDAKGLANLYGLLYQEAAYEVTQDISGEGIIWARSGWAGCQRFPVHWGGDAAASWEGMAGSLKGGLHLGLSGFGFWSHDVPGFHGVPDFMNSVIPDDLYVRWTQFGVFTSHIRYHGTSKREPYSFPGISEIVKRWWHLRYALLPYILESSIQTTNSGLPVLRGMLLHFPDDHACWHIDDQYFFGDAFLVAPMLTSEDCRDVYLPEGSWVHFFSGKQTEGPRWLKNHKEELADMPVWTKEGAKVPLNPKKVNHTGEIDPEKTLELKIGENFKGIWYWMEKNQFANG